ncbi:MAG: tRNA-dihydrouridine synthase family protein [Thermoplasmata archaeon]|nr:tRNA-dihydrouridine synthase family protein [Thermoplasmata archaeon]MBE3139241.1 tRNA-dihydrouridine synthase family protein [Thermoplasmata archaeon]
MKIGTVEIQNRFVLAPLAGISCTAFRMLCKENGAGLLYTQMIDSDIISEKTSDEVKQFLNIQDTERPVAVQLIGSEKNILVKAVHAVEEFADIIDLNVGCIEEDYLTKRCGAALLKDLPKLESILRAMVEATDKPVTAKIRIGWDNQNINGVKVSQLIENSGAQALCIHGRTADQQYAGKVNWTIMKQAKEKVHIPVIANGDVTSYTDGLTLLKKTGCDLVMIGREAQHCPWIFNQETVDIKQQILRFIDLYEQYENRQSAIEVADHVFWMLRDFKTSENTKKVHLIGTISRIKRYVNRLQQDE